MVTYEGVHDAEVARELLRAGLLYWGWCSNYCLAGEDWLDSPVESFPLYREPGECRFYIRLEE